MDRRFASTEPQPKGGLPVAPLDAARATDCFEIFLNASTLKTILGTYRNICDLLHLKPNALPQFYPKLRASLTSWRAKALWKKFDARANNKVYGKGKLCPNTRVLIIGGGPCGLRTAIEAQLLGAKVVVVEKRDRMSRNNVLHLWPFVIDDLRSLGAKKFFGKFCAGAIDHISIRQLQCILLKVALLLGVEVHTEVSFERLVEPNPNEKTGWRAEFKPEEHPVSQFEFDVIIGADGKRNTLEGFKRKEFRGKLAIAITANFINKRTEAEARVEEISGVAFIFNQKFFKDLYADTGIDLENIVYYKDDTHYFVMTAKKASLIDKGVIRQDLPDTARLLAPDNVNRGELMNYAREAAEFSTNYYMMDLEFAVNHYGQPDVAMFDFTSMYAAENASKFIERNGYKLLTILVGDSLLEPFWPTGSGCARGFLSSLDAGWAIRGYGTCMLNPLEVLAERESIYRLLAQTTPENLNKDYKGYTLDPSTRYPNLNKNLLLPQQVLSLYDTDDAKSIELFKTPLSTNNALDVPKKRRRRESHVDPDTLLVWIREQVKEHEDLRINDITNSFKDGRVLCAIISHYRPDLLDYSAITPDEAVKNNQMAFDLLEKEIGIPPVMTGEEMVNANVPDFLTMVSYLTLIYDTFRCEIPHIKHPKLKPFPHLKKPSEEERVPPSKQPLEKSKFSLVNRNPRNEELVEVIWLNDTMMKSVKEYKSETTMTRDNSKSLVFKASISDFSSGKSKSEKNVEEVINEQIHKSLNAMTKSAYLLESKILQEKINAVLAKARKRRRKSKIVLNNLKSPEPHHYISSNVIASNVIVEKNYFRVVTSYGDVCEEEKPAEECVALVENVIEENVPTDSDVHQSSISLNYEDACEEVQHPPLRSCDCCQANKRNLAADPEERNVDIVISDENSVQTIKLSPIRNCVSIVFPGLLQTLKSGLGLNPVSLEKTKLSPRRKRHELLEGNKFLSLAKMSHSESTSLIQMDHTFDRVVNWISASNFNVRYTDSPKTSSIHLDGLTDITSVTRQHKTNANVTVEKVEGILVEKVEDIVKFNSDGTKTTKNMKEGKSTSLESINKFLEELKNPENMTQRLTKFSHCPSNKLYEKRIRSRSEPPSLFSIIVENEENELTEPKRSENAFTKNHPAIQAAAMAAPPQVAIVHSVHRPSSRNKRHTVEVSPSAVKYTAALNDRKPRKRKTMEKLNLTNVEDRMKRLEEIAQNRMDRHSKRRQHRKMQTDQFIKSMQMLQANCKPDHSEPFEDYSIFLYRQTAPNFEDRVKDLEKKFTYIPDHENRLPTITKGEKDEDFQARIRGMEDKWCEPTATEKKPKDLLRAIGKIDSSDWNIKEIEKKIHENRLGKVNKDKERVPKWSQEQFRARQMKMEKQHLERQDSTGGKFAEIDKNIKQLDQKLKEGNARDVNQQKVAKITEKLLPKNEAEAKPIQKSNSKTVIIPPKGNSDMCHFCSKRVYLMERLSAEGKFFHRGCFRCQHCHTALRLGSYLYDRDGKYGYRFYCSQHFGMPGEVKTSKVTRKPSQRNKEGMISPEKKVLSGVAGVDLLDRVQTPERIEFANLSTGNASSDHDESLSQMDEDEWTDKNFGASTAEMGSSDDDSSSMSDTDSDDEDAYEEALEEPPTKEGTMKWAERYNKRYSRKRVVSDSEEYSSSEQSSYYENSSGDDESDTATEGEEEIRARELRKQEVRVEPPVVHTDTGTDTEIASNETSTESSSEVQNSATEISTDSEFAHDDPTPTREVPSIVFNDAFVTKTRGRYVPPQKVQVKTSEIQKPVNSKTHSRDIQLKFTPLVLTPIVRKPAPAHLLQTEGYALNRTQSTGGIATKVSLELKKKYLLGESSPSNLIQKSGSASTLDSKFKSFHSTISDCQKLLKPAAEVSSSMQTFCNKLNERSSPVSPLFVSPPTILKDAPKIQDEAPEKNAVEELESEKVTKLPPFENENEGRPRSPVHETSIIVPQIDWSQQKENQSNNTSESSSCTSSSSDSDVKEMQKSPSVKQFSNIPKLEVLDVDSKDNLPVDSLNYEVNYTKLAESLPSSINEPPKSIASDKKVLNQPKPLPNLAEDLILNQVHTVLHNKQKIDDGKTSGRSTPSNNDSCVALTETELSDWAREGAVSDDFEDVEYKLNSAVGSSRRNRKPKTIKKTKEVSEQAIVAETDDHKHVCGKVQADSLIECVNSILNPNLDNIEFMDTGTESSDDEVVEVKNNGYVQFHDEDDIPEDSLSPTINVNVIETTNPKVMATFDEDFDDLSTVSRNTGYCIIATTENGKNPFGGEVIDLKPTDLEILKEKRSQCENEEDSLLIIETGTTTEENTCSDSTVKNVTQITPSKEKEITITENNNTLDKKRLEDKLAQVKKDMKKLNEQRKAEQIVEQNLRNNIEFEQHCQRLQSKVDFGNARDSIDIRKSRRQSKTGSPPKPDLIQEEKEVSPVRSRRELLELERDLNQKLVQEMVMNKMKAQNKSLERKRRNRNSFSPSVSPCRPMDLSKSATTNLGAQLKSPTPDVLLSTMNVGPVQKSQTVAALSEFNKTPEPRAMPRAKYVGSKMSSRPLSVHTAFLTGTVVNTKLPEMNLASSAEAFSLPDIQKALVMDQFQTPKVPPRLKNEEAKRTIEKLKEDARARARLLSDEDLGLSPEDKLAKLRQLVNRRGKENDVEVHIQDSIESLVMNTERRNSLLYSNDTLRKKKNNSFRRSKSGEEHLNITNVQTEKDSRERTKSVSELNKQQMSVVNHQHENVKNKQCFKSDPNLLANNEGNKKEKKKSKDRERRKSITRMITDLFATKKKDPSASVNNGNKGFLARISPKARDKSKDVIKEEPVRRMSFTEIRRSVPGNVSPPPIPPLPLNYTGTKSIEDSSEGESDYKRIDRSSCDTLDQSGIQDGSVSSRRSGRSAKRAARQSQLKRHRMAQEIQRKLEETEVKTRELEQRGVRVEKAIRRESDDISRDETELLKEWFDLMRDMTELRRYERELMVRAQELELEDRHARLQHELKERLDSGGQKTQEDFETEGSIITEMMDIVRKRDSLIALLEEDRQRYSEEDKGFEEQMLAKGINSSPMLLKVTDK